MRIHSTPIMAWDEMDSKQWQYGWIECITGQSKRGNQMSVSTFFILSGLKRYWKNWICVLKQSSTATPIEWGIVVEAFANHLVLQKCETKRPHRNHVLTTLLILLTCLIGSLENFSWGQWHFNLHGMRHWKRLQRWKHMLVYNLLRQCLCVNHRLMTA